VARPNGSIHDNFSATPKPGGCAPSAALEIASVRLPILSMEKLGVILCAVVENPPPLWIDDMGLLRTEEAVEPVRVVSLERLRTAADGSAGGTGTFEIRLEHTVESNSAQRVHGLRLRHLLYATLTSLVPMEGSRPWSRRALIAFLLAVALVFGYIMLHGHLATFRDGIPSCRHAIASLIHRPDDSSEISAGVANSVPGEGPVVGSPASSTAQIARRPGVEPFLRPEIVAALRLTDVQKIGFRHLDETAQQALKDVDQYWAGESDSVHAEKRAMILDAARRQAIRLLTAEQLRKWNALGGG
jgi:hypothetical protein